MTPRAFLDECSRRGIALSVTEAGGIRYRSPGTLPPSVRNTLTRHKVAIVRALGSVPVKDTTPHPLHTSVAAIPATEVWTLADGRMLYRWGEADWRYVPPLSDPGDHLDNFPAELRGVARRRYVGKRGDAK